MRRWIKFGSLGLAVALVATLVIMSLSTNVDISQSGFLSVSTNVALAVGNPPSSETTGLHFENPGGGGMEQVIFGGYYDLLSASATEYNALQGGYNWHGTEANRYKLVSTGGKIKNLRVKLNDSPGAGKHYDFTLLVNGAPSALTVEIADAATSGADTTHEVDVTAGQTVSLQCAATGTPTARYATWTTMFEGSTAKESLILGGSSADPSATKAEYQSVGGTYGYWSDVEVDFRQVCPTSGKIKNFYVKLEKDPGTAPDAYRFTLRVNGANSDDGEGNPLQVTIVADDTTGNDTTHEITVAAGDILTMMCEPLEDPSVNLFAVWGMTFVADTDGESIILSGTSVHLDDTDTEYNYILASTSLEWTATEAERYQLGQVCTLKKLYILLSGGPGAGKSYTFTLRKPGNGQADGNLTVTIADAATTGNDVAHEDAIADDDYVDLRVVPFSTPTVRDAYWGLVCYIAPPEPNISNTPSEKAFGNVFESSSYWSNSSAPTWPLDDSECYFTVTNNGDTCSITIKATNFTGGDGWTLTSGSPGSGTVRLRAGKSGDANEDAMVILTTEEQAFIAGLVTTKKWELKVETGTFTDYVLKTSTATLTATLD